MTKHCGLIGDYCSKDDCSNCVHVDGDNYEYEWMEDALEEQTMSKDWNCIVLFATSEAVQVNMMNQVELSDFARFEEENYQVVYAEKYNPETTQSSSQLCDNMFTHCQCFDEVWWQDNLYIYLKEYNVNRSMMIGDCVIIQQEDIHQVHRCMMNGWKCISTYIDSSEDSKLPEWIQSEVETIQSLLSEENTMITYQKLQSQIKTTAPTTVFHIEGYIGNRHLFCNGCCKELLYMGKNGEISFQPIDGESFMGTQGYILVHPDEMDITKVEYKHDNEYCHVYMNVHFNY